jgi:hypothetical protein
MNAVSSASANNSVISIFNNDNLSRFEELSDFRVRKVKLFISTSSPGDLSEFA